MVMEEREILKRTELYVSEVMCNNTAGHDWWHIYRVRRLALAISNKEGGDSYIVEMAALLHDVDDWKMENGSENAKKWMESLSLPKPVINQILEIIEQVSFKGNLVDDCQASLEGEIVRDADRLDAIGAIGIARAFAYGGSKGRMMYNPGEKPIDFCSFEAYKNSSGTTINHFYEKLLILKNRINTPTAKTLAEKRHQYMVDFLNHFFMEWDAEI
jgi:uncharacterized protein